MKNESLNIVICGHIDHGKSTLIGRLLLDTNSLPDDRIKELQRISKEFGEETQIAYLSDQLKEEREKNITIETTQVFLKTKKRSYVLIDTPGHLEFIKNMLTGASHADAAMLLVDIKEGIKEQTRRHAYLLNLLALKNILVLINKMDLVQYSEDDFRNCEKEILELFKELGLKPRHIIPVCAKRGENICYSSQHMPWYRGPWLSKAMDDLNAAEEKQSSGFRFPVQDVYEINGEKILVGRIASGAVRNGQKLTIFPQNTTVTLKEIKTFGKKTTTARALTSIGMTLTMDIPIQRGDVLTEDNYAEPLANHFKGNIIWLSKKELLRGQSIQLRCATQSFQSTATKILEKIDPSTLSTIEKDSPRLNLNEAALVEFKILTPAFVENYSMVPELGRFTIESTDELLGAGIILQTFSVDEK